jgi:hypothetical protein
MTATAKRQAMKPVKAWAVVEPCGRIAIWDYRLPCTWLRRLASRDKDERLDGPGRIVRVLITELERKR